MHPLNTASHMPGPIHLSSTTFGDHLWASSAVNVDLDLTFLMHFILFGAFVVIMKDLIFDPMIKVFERREKMTSGEIDEARKMDEEAIALKQELDAKLEEIRREAATDREQVRARVKKLENELLEDARSTMDAKLDKGMRQIREEVEAIQAELAKKRAPLAADIATRVLGREVEAKEARS